MAVGIDEARQHRLTLQVNECGRRARGRGDIGATSRGENQPVAYGYGLHVRRRVADHRDDGAVRVDLGRGRGGIGAGGAAQERHRQYERPE